jgi:DNA-binding beta-propeller fold protein YncE
VQREPFTTAAGKGLFYGLALRADGHLFVSGGGDNSLVEYSYDGGAKLPLSAVGTVKLPLGTYPAGLAFVDATHLLVAYQKARAVALIDSTDGSEIWRQLLAPAEPYDIVVDAGGHKAYVSSWNSDSVAVLDISGSLPTLAGKITTGKNPEQMLLYPAAAPTQLLVANSDQDTVSVVDLASQTVTQELDVTPSTRPQHGVIPNALAIAGARLYVASAGDDAIDVFATGTWQHLGRIPTGWYPTAVLAFGGGVQLLVANGKGMGSGPTAADQADSETHLAGTLSRIDLGSADVAAGATQVEANNLRAQQLGPRLDCPSSAPAYALPPTPGARTPIEHVVFIVRENKTYDANLGDLARAKGDPKLVMWGEHVTPNLHALAQKFANGDNFYSNAEMSIQGHEWTTGGTANDYIEKGWLTIWGRHWREAATAGLRIATPVDGYYWQYFARNGIDYIDYGEAVGVFGNTLPTDPPILIDTGWPGGLYFNLDSKDVDKAKYFADQVLTYDILPRFNYVMLPNNHTSGLEAGAWTPEYMVADNDEATGRVVDALSHSTHWRSTVIFIIEDDPSDGYDHIEAHRSTLVVAGPWIKHGYVSSMHYDDAALWRTMELLLGLPPRTQQTATAPAMWDLFASTPDDTPYTFIPANVVEARNPTPAKPLPPMDFSAVDRARGLGPLLWRHLKGTEPPAALAGAPDDDD